MLRTGVTGAGQRLWSKAEDRIVIACYPDHRKAVRQLTGARSYWGVRHRAERLGIQIKRHIWTNRDIANLRALWRAGASDRELTAAFPGLTRHAICGKARHKGFGPRPRKPPKVLGIPILDAVRKRTHDLDMSLRDLDRETRARCYWGHNSHRVVPRHVFRAVKALGGRIRIEWDDLR